MVAYCAFAKGRIPMPDQASRFRIFRDCREQIWIVRQKYLTIGRREESMTTLTVTAKGQITLKRDLLKHLGVGPGEKIEADKLPDGRIVVRAATRDGTISDFVGCLSQRGGPKLTIDEINEIASRGWAKRK